MIEWGGPVAKACKTSRAEGQTAFLARCRAQQERRYTLQMAFMITAGNNLVHWREGLREVKSGMSTGLLRWFKDQVERLQGARGFNMAKALEVAMHLSNGTLPIFLLCGTLQPDMKMASGADEGDATARIVQQIAVAQQEVATKRLR